MVFEIQGELWGQPAPVQLFLETLIEVETRVAMVRELKDVTLMDPRLLRHYENELQFLRDMGAEFAAEFPKVAARLDLGNAEVADPYVERLLEGFAFLAARIQLKMEAEFPTFTQSLLQMVYPHYLAPTPSMAIVQIKPDDALRSTPEGSICRRAWSCAVAGHRRSDQLRIPHGPFDAPVTDRYCRSGVHRLTGGGSRAWPG